MTLTAQKRYELINDMRNEVRKLIGDDDYRYTLFLCGMIGAMASDASDSAIKVICEDLASLKERVATEQASIKP